MANGKGPRIPRNLRPDLEKVNGLLQDISVKISNIHQLDDTFRLNIDIQGEDDIESLEKSLRNLGKTTKAAEKINSALVKNLQVRNATEKKLSDAIDRTISRISKESTHQQELAKKMSQSQDVLKLYENQMKSLQAKMASGQKMKKKEIEQLEKLRREYIDEKAALSNLNEEQKKSMGALQKDQQLLDKQAEAVEKIDGKYTVLAKTLGNQVLGALDKIGTGLTTLAIDAVFFSLGKLKDGFMAIYDLMERTTKATGAFNLAMGGATAGLDKTRGEAWKVEGQMRALTGGELGVGLQMWQDTSKALGFVGEGFDQMSTKATVAGRALGIGGQAAGEFARSMMLMGDSAGDLDKDFGDIIRASNAAGVSVADFGKEIVQSKNFMASFGKVGKKTFLDSAAFAKKLGVSLQSLERFTELTDSFEQTAQMGAKMNTVFGTSLNSMELMLEQDPSKRLEMVREQFKQQGKSWDNMNRQERKFFAQTMQLSEEEAEGVLNNKMTLDDFRKKQEKDAKNKVRDEEMIRRGLSKTAETLMNWKQQFDAITKSMMGLFNPILEKFGLVKSVGKDGKKEFMSFGEIVGKAVGKIQEFFNKLSKNDKVMAFVNQIADDIGGIMTAFLTKGPEADKEMSRIVNTVGDFAEGVGDLYTAGKKFVKEVFTKKNLEFAMKVFGFIGRNIKPIVAGFLGLKLAMGGVTLFNGLNTTVELLTGGKGLIPILGQAASAMAGPLMSAIKMAGSALGQAGLVAAAGAAGYAIGTMANNVEIGGKKVGDILVDAAVAFKDNLVIMIEDSWEAIKKLINGIAGKVGLEDMLPDFLKPSSFESTLKDIGGFGSDELKKQMKEQIQKAGRGELSEKELSSLGTRLSSARDSQLKSLLEQAGVKDASVLQKKLRGSSAIKGYATEAENPYLAAAKAGAKGVDLGKGLGFSTEGAKKDLTTVKDIATGLVSGAPGIPAQVPIQASAISPVPVTTDQKQLAKGDKNYAKKAKEAASTAGKEGVLVTAGDIYLDGQLVGRTLARAGYVK